METFTNASTEVFMGASNCSMKVFMEAMEDFMEAMEAFMEAMEASTEAFMNFHAKTSSAGDCTHGLLIYTMKKETVNCEKIIPP